MPPPLANHLDDDACADIYARGKARYERLSNPQVKQLGEIKFDPEATGAGAQVPTRISVNINTADRLPTFEEAMHKSLLNILEPAVHRWRFTNYTDQPLTEYLAEVLSNAISSGKIHGTYTKLRNAP